MNKNIFLLGISFLMLLLGLTSCEQELSAEDCLAINAMQVNTTEIKSGDDKQSVIYAFTPSNAKFLNLDYTWSINGQVVEGVTNSLFQNTFTENGTFEVCFVAIPKKGSSCVVESICTSLTIDSLELEEVAVEVEEEEGSEESEEETTSESELTCDDLTLEAIRFSSRTTIVQIPQRKGNISTFSHLSQSVYVWTVDGKELTQDEISELDDDRFNDFSLVTFSNLAPGVHTFKVFATVPGVCDTGVNIETSITLPEVEVPAEPVAPTTPAEPVVEEPTTPVTPTEPVVEVPVGQGTPAVQDCSDVVITARQRSDFNGQARFVVALEPISLVSVTRGDASAITWTVNGVILSNEELANNGRNPIASALGDFTRINFLENPGTYTIEARINSPDLCSEGRVLSTTITVD